MDINKKISFNVPLFCGNEIAFIQKAIENGKICGDGIFTKQCNELIEKLTNTKKSLLTTSCTHALEMAALLGEIKRGDEIIMPSFTFVSTANPFVLRGAKIIFVDISPNTMNINESLIEKEITSKTKAIVPVHYAGVACEMDTIRAIANQYNLLLIEDAAQGILSSFNGSPLGSLGTFGCISFHETKNITCGEGGCILINDSKYLERAEIIREKGTDRSKFLRGQIDKYSWVDIGSSYLPSDINAAYLFAQLNMVELITKKRLKLWDLYFNSLKSIADNGFIELPFVPDYCQHNAHMFYIKLKDINMRQNLMDFLRDKGIQTVFHYIPLHSSKAGKLFGEFRGKDLYTTRESERILRLPLYFSMEDNEVYYVVENIINFFSKK